MDNQPHRFAIRALCLLMPVLLVLCGAQAEETSHTAILDGIKIHYRDIGKKSALPLIFIHGLACDSSFWDGQIETFADTYRIIAIDLPGFGKSDKPQDIAYTQHLFAQAVKTVMEMADVRQPVLIGHSMGYTVARQFLIDYPGEARALVNVDGALVRIPDDAQKLEQWKQQMKGFSTLFTEPNRLVKMIGFIDGLFSEKTPESVRKVVRNAMLTADAYATASAVNEFANPTQWTEKSFNVPALILYAEHPEGYPDLKEYFQKIFPNSRFQQWNDVGHFIMLDQPERFNMVLGDFLKALQHIP